MNSSLKPGLRCTRTLRVDASLTVPAVSSQFEGFVDMPPVFATAFMIGFIESTCIEALRPCLAAHERTVGMHVDVSHMAATAVGMSVTAEIELVAVDGRQLHFTVRCRDDAGTIGEGTHARAIVDAARFIARATDRATHATRAIDVLGRSFDAVPAPSA